MFNFIIGNATLKECTDIFSSNFMNTEGVNNKNVKGGTVIELPTEIQHNTFIEIV